MKRKAYLLIYFVIFNFAAYAQNIQLIFRYDDYKLKTDSLNEAVVQVFQKHNIPLVIGIIPYDKDERPILEKDYPFFHVLKKSLQNQSVEVALHGYNHQRIAHGEFGNLPVDEQYRRMQKGKAILDSVFDTKVITFIPPWNSYDTNTLVVMEKIGMKIISSALSIEQAFSNPTITYCPYTIEDFSSLTSTLKNNKNRKAIVVVMFHNYTFLKRNYSISKLDSLLSSINNLNYVKCVSFMQLYRTGEILNRERMLVNMETNNLLYKYLNLNGVIQTTFFAYAVRILNSLLYIILSAFIYFVSLTIISHKVGLTKQKKILCLFLLLFMVGFGVWFHLLGPLKLVLFVMILSFFWPLLLKLNLSKRK